MVSFPPCNIMSVLPILSQRFMNLHWYKWILISVMKTDNRTRPYQFWGKRASKRLIWNCKSVRSFVSFVINALDVVLFICQIYCWCIMA
jgi:hypothetical protein